MHPRLFRLLINLWAPFRGAGIRVTHVAEDYGEVRVELRLGLLNRNHMGTHFGGSLFAMTDPFFPLIVLHRLGRDYTVSHKAGSIDYLAAVRGVVSATFRVDESDLDAIRDALTRADRHAPSFEVDIEDASGAVVARARHTLSIRRRAPRGADASR